MMEKKTRWAEIKDYEGYYWVSDDGQVKSKNGIMKLRRNKRGYVTVGLSKNGKQFSKFVHRLVAQAFVENPNPKEYNCVNHLDECKDNNVYTNLSWTNIAENNRWGTGYARRMETRRNTKHIKPNPIYSLSVNDDGTFILTAYSSIYQASKMTGTDYSSIYRCCKGLMKTTGGMYFFYK